MRTRTAVVTGASSGIGAAIARKLGSEGWNIALAANLKSVLYGMQAVVPHFQERGEGHLINISSFLGRVPFVSFRSAYSAAKAAVNILTANLRMDLRRHPGVHVSLVMPGTVMTDFARNALGGTPAMPPGGRSPMVPQTPEEVADQVRTLIENPKADLYTNPASPELAARYYQDVGAFEDEMFGGR